MSKYVLPLDQLQAISRKVHTSSDPAEIERSLSLALGFYGLINYQYRYDRALWRGVLCDSSDGHTNIRRVGYPPPELSRNGRLNEAGHPLLYVSVNQFTVLEEIGAKAGDYVHMTAYAFKQGEKLRAGIVGEITQVHRWGRSLSSESLSQELNRILNGLEFEAGKSFVFTDALLTSILRDRKASESDYLRSRILAKLLFAKLDGLEAMIYPSVAHEGAMNLAITPHAADSKLKIGTTFVVHVLRKYDYGLYDFEVVRKAKGQHGDGTIDWQ